MDEVKVYSLHKEDNYVVEGEHGSDKVFLTLVPKSDFDKKDERIKELIQWHEKKDRKIQEYIQFISGVAPSWLPENFRNARRKMLKDYGIPDAPSET